MVDFSFFCVSSLLLEDVDLLIISFAVLIAVVGGNRVFGLSWQLLGLIVGLTLGDA